MAGNPLEELGATILNLEDRVAELERWRTTHTQSMTQRQQQVSAVADRQQRDRFLQSLRRRGR